MTEHDRLADSRPNVYWLAILTTVYAGIYDWHALALLALITALVIIIAFVFWLRLSR